VRIDYATPGKPTEARTIDPYCTWFAAGSVYVVAYCHKAEDTRTFAVQRIKRATVLDEAFDPDPSFDPAAFTRKGFGVYHGPVYRVTIDFSPKVDLPWRWPTLFKHCQQSIGIQSSDWRIQQGGHAGAAIVNHCA